MIDPPIKHTPSSRKNDHVTWWKLLLSSNLLSFIWRYLVLTYCCSLPRSINVIFYFLTYSLKIMLVFLFHFLLVSYWDSYWVLDCGLKFATSCEVLCLWRHLFKNINVFFYNLICFFFHISWLIPIFHIHLSCDDIQEPRITIYTPYHSLCIWKSSDQHKVYYFN